MRTMVVCTGAGGAAVTGAAAAGAGGAVPRRGRCRRRAGRCRWRLRQRRHRWQGRRPPAPAGRPGSGSSPGKGVIGGNVGTAHRRQGGLRQRSRRHPSFGQFLDERDLVARAGTRIGRNSFDRLVLSFDRQRLDRNRSHHIGLRQQLAIWRNDAPGRDGHGIDLHAIEVDAARPIRVRCRQLEPHLHVGPTRRTVRSDTGPGTSRSGASGGPFLPHAASAAKATTMTTLGR